MKQKVLLVCFGNTCRSPMAEAIFNNCIIKMELTSQWEVDSAGLRGYHLGEPPNVKAMNTLRFNGIINYSHQARIITSDDFFLFNWIFGMDGENIVELNRMKPETSQAQINLLRQYDPEGIGIIRDPYCDDGYNGFIEAYTQSVRSIENFLKVHNSNSK